MRMCGIFGYIGKRENAPSIVLDGLRTLEYRGYDSWGVAVVPTAKLSNYPINQLSNKIFVKKKAGKIGDATVSEMPKSTLAFGHTRWATHGGVTDTNAHPHADCTGTIALIHNGIFENYEEYKKRLKRKGHVFVSDTDTEVIVHLVEDYAKTMIFTKAVQRAFNDMVGLNAIIAMDAKSRTFVAVRTGSPLVVGYGKGENFLASDATALLPHTKRVYFLKDNEMAVISDDVIRIMQAKNGSRVSPTLQKLDWSVAQADRGKYPHFMLKEIYEQPTIVTDIASSAPGQTMKLAMLIKKSYGAYMVGCGTASYACLAGSYLFSKISRRHINWAVGSEFGYYLDFITDRSLVIALSQSGETMDILESMKKVREKGAKIFALVNVLGSTLYREAHDKMLLGAGPEKGVASTKAFTAKLAHLVLLAYALKGSVKEGQKVLRQAVISAKKVLSPTFVRKIRTLAKRLKNREHLYVIGRGLSYPASLEVALKIKEVSYIHAEGFAAGELKHGVIALVDKGTPCIAFLPNDETYGANLAGAMEMKARGGYIIGVSYKPHEVFDMYVPVCDAREATIIPNVIVGQLLAYYLSIQRGLDPDKPRNLAKSVTVK